MSNSRLVWMNEISEQSLGGRSGTTSGRFPNYLISPLLSSPYCPCFNSQLSSLPGIAGVLFIDYFHPPNRGTPDGSEGKESACNARDTGDESLIPGLGRSPGERNGNPLQYLCLENSMDRGVWQSVVHGVPKNWTWLSDFTFFLCRWCHMVFVFLWLHLVR